MYFVAEPKKDTRAKTLQEPNDTYIIQRGDLLFEMFVFWDSDLKIECLVANLSRHKFKLTPENITFKIADDTLALIDDPRSKEGNNIFYEHLWGINVGNSRPNRSRELYIESSDVKIFGFGFSPWAVNRDSSYSMNQFHIIIELQNVVNDSTEEFSFHFRKRD